MKYIPMLLTASMLAMATTQASVAVAPQSQVASQSAIGIERAMQIAKQRINAQVVEIEYDRHYNDQNSEYEVKLVDATTEYELDINANTGTITELKQEALDNDDIAEYNKLKDSKLDLLQSVQFAAQHLNGQVLEAQFDVEDGIPRYKLEVVADGKKYDVDIDASTARATIVED